MEEMTKIGKDNSLLYHVDELADILKKLAIMNGEALVLTFVEFENEWGEDFECTPEFNLDNPEED
jgi:hypothetical protein